MVDRHDSLAQPTEKELQDTYLAACDFHKFLSGVLVKLLYPPDYIDGYNFFVTMYGSTKTIETAIYTLCLTLLESIMTIEFDSIMENYELGESRVNLLLNDRVKEEMVYILLFVKSKKVLDQNQQVFYSRIEELIKAVGISFDHIDQRFEKFCNRPDPDSDPYINLADLRPIRIKLNSFLMKCKECTHFETQPFNELYSLLSFGMKCIDVAKLIDCSSFHVIPSVQQMAESVDEKSIGQAVYRCLIKLLLAIISKLEKFRFSKSELKNHICDLEKCISQLLHHHLPNLDLKDDDLEALKSRLTGVSMTRENFISSTTSRECVYSELSTSASSGAQGREEHYQLRPG